MTRTDSGKGGVTTEIHSPDADPDSYRWSLMVVVESRTMTHALPLEGTVVLGRAPFCQVSVDDASVSRRHALLRIGPERITLEDLDSSNGTRVGGETLQPGHETEFSAGQVADIGSASLMLRKISRVSMEPASVGSPVGAAMASVKRMIDQIAAGQIAVLIRGETGVGKEVVARSLHQLSRRADKPFLALHCAALPESLIESELFGHEASAFTGANQRKQGLIESATGGTVFLDEIGELTPAVQVKLLRVLEDRAVLRVGALRPTPIDVRFVAATNRNLDAAIASGAFREDLYFRINGVTIDVPPLRERFEELEPLVDVFTKEVCEVLGRDSNVEFDPASLDALRAYPWPGNIRELRNVVERAILLAEDGPVRPEHLQLRAQEGPIRDGPRPRASDERACIIEALRECGGNQSRAATRLGISRRTLSSRLNKYGIPRPLKGRK